jgi:hypothetical protein
METHHCDVGNDYEGKETPSADVCSVGRNDSQVIVQRPPEFQVEGRGLSSGNLAGREPTLNMREGGSADIGDVVGIGNPAAGSDRSRAGMGYIGQLRDSIQSAGSPSLGDLCDAGSCRREG